MSAIFQFSDYRSYLKEVLAKLKEKNPQFSLRALARKLEMPPSFLSEVLNGKKNLSLDRALQIGRLLRLEIREITFLCYLVALENCSDEEQRASLLNELELFSSSKERQTLDLKRFEVISSWECIAVLELLTVFPARSADFYAWQLNLPLTQIEKALLNLEHSRLIEITQQGPTRTNENLLITSQNHHLALKMYHCSMLEKARYAIYHQSPATRYTGTETLMIDPELLPEAHQIMNECLDRLLVIFNKSSKKSSLVHIHFNLFELNQSRKKAGS